MKNGKIKEVVLGFKRVVDNIPSVYDNFDDALDKFYEAFYLTMSEMLPMKYFALYEDRHGYYIAIFDRKGDCMKWVCEIVGLPNATCIEIPFSKFIELSYDEWSNPNCYVEGLDGVVTFGL